MSESPRTHRHHHHHRQGHHLHGDEAQVGFSNYLKDFMPAEGDDSYTYESTMSSVTVSDGTRTVTHGTASAKDSTGHEKRGTFRAHNDTSHLVEEERRGDDEEWKKTNKLVNADNLEKFDLEYEEAKKALKELKHDERPKLKHGDDEAEAVEQKKDA